MARVLFLAVLIAGFICPALSQNSRTSVSKDPQAMAIAQKAIAAMGGTSLLAYQDSLASGTLTVFSEGKQMQYGILLKTKGTQETRTEITMQAGPNVRILNHGQAVIERPNGTTIRLSQKNTFSERVNHIPLLSILSEYTSEDVNLSYAGAVSDTQTYDVIALTCRPSQTTSLPTTTPITFFVNRATGMVDKVQYDNWDENEPTSEKVTTYFYDYQTVNEIAVPFKQTTYIGSDVNSELILNSINFNLDLPENSFTLPAGASDAQ